MVRRIISLVLSFCFLFQQTGLVQAAAVELNLSNYFARIASGMSVDNFRPVHLRYFSYDSLNNSFKVLLDKGDLNKGLSPKGTVPEAQLKEETKELLKYFLIGVTLPNDKFWVNLRPDSPSQIIDFNLEETDIGKVMLEADLQLKKDTALFTSPQTPEGREYWNKLYKKASELYGNENITIPTLTRPWIVPNEIIVRETKDSAYVYKATLKVMLESDYLRDGSQDKAKLSPGAYEFKDSRAKALNEYSSQLIRELIIPKLTKEVNLAKRYAPLRQVYYSLILSRWFKLRFQGQSGTYPSLIDKNDLANLTSKTSWDKSTYFNAYKKSFAEGEYNIQEPVYTPSGQTIRSYMSGGVQMAGSAIKIDGSRLIGNVKDLPKILSKKGWLSAGAKINIIKPVEIRLQLQEDMAHGTKVNTLATQDEDFLSVSTLMDGIQTTEGDAAHTIKGTSSSMKKVKSTVTQEEIDSAYGMLGDRNHKVKIIIRESHRQEFFEILKSELLRMKDTGSLEVEMGDGKKFIALVGAINILNGEAGQVCKITYGSKITPLDKSLEGKIILVPQVVSSPISNKDLLDKKSFTIFLEGKQLEVRKGGNVTIDITASPAPTKGETMGDYLSTYNFKVEDGAYFGNECSVGGRDYLNIPGLTIFAVDKDQSQVGPGVTPIGVGPAAVEIKLKEIIKEIKSNSAKYKFLGFDIDDTLLGTKNKGDRVIKQTLKDDWPGILEAFMELFQMGISIVIFTDNSVDVVKEETENMEGLVGQLVKELRERNIVLKEEELVAYADGMVTKFKVTPLYQYEYDANYQKKRISREDKERILSFLGVDLGTNKIIKGSRGALSQFYFNDLADRSGDIQQVIRSSYPDYNPQHNKLGQFVTVQRRSEFPDGSVAQINIVPMPTRRTKGAVLNEGALDEREKLIKYMLEQNDDDNRAIQNYSYTQNMVQLLNGMNLTFERIDKLFSSSEKTQYITPGTSQFGIYENPVPLLINQIKYYKPGLLETDTYEYNIEPVHLNTVRGRSFRIRVYHDGATLYYIYGNREEVDKIVCEIDAKFLAAETMKILEPELTSTSSPAGSNQAAEKVTLRDIHSTTMPKLVYEDIMKRLEKVKLDSPGAFRQLTGKVKSLNISMDNNVIEYLHNLGLVNPYGVPNQDAARILRIAVEEIRGEQYLVSALKEDSTVASPVVSSPLINREGLEKTLDALENTPWEVTYDSESARPFERQIRYSSFWNIDMFVIGQGNKTLLVALKDDKNTEKYRLIFDDLQTLGIPEKNVRSIIIETIKKELGASSAVLQILRGLKTRILNSKANHSNLGGQNYYNTAQVKVEINEALKDLSDKERELALSYIKITPANPYNYSNPEYLSTIEIDLNKAKIELEQVNSSSEPLGAASPQITSSPMQKKLTDRMLSLISMYLGAKDHNEGLELKKKYESDIYVWLNTINQETFDSNEAAAVIEAFVTYAVEGNSILANILDKKLEEKAWPARRAPLKETTLAFEKKLRDKKIKDSELKIIAEILNQSLIEAAKGYGASSAVEGIDMHKEALSEIRKRYGLSKTDTLTVEQIFEVTALAYNLTAERNDHPDRAIVIDTQEGPNIEYITKEEFESSLSSSPLGGIDFKGQAMASATTYEAMGSFSGLDFSLPKLSSSVLLSFNLDKEQADITKAIDNGIIVSGQRIKEFMAASANKGQLGERRETVLTWLAKLGILEETICCTQESSKEYREALVIADSV